MSEMAELIINQGVMTVIVIIFLWQFIDEKQERKKRAVIEEEQKERLILNGERMTSVVENNNKILYASDAYHKDLDNRLEGQHKEFVGVLNHIRVEVGELSEKLNKQDELNDKDREMLRVILEVVKGLEK